MLRLYCNLEKRIYEKRINNLCIYIVDYIGRKRQYFFCEMLSFSRADK